MNIQTSSPTRRGRSGRERRAGRGLEHQGCADKPAQGNALGRTGQDGPALKGRHIPGPAPSGLAREGGLFPGLRPGLAWGWAFGPTDGGLPPWPERRAGRGVVFQTQRRRGAESAEVGPRLPLCGLCVSASLRLPIQLPRRCHLRWRRCDRRRRRCRRRRRRCHLRRRRFDGRRRSFHRRWRRWQGRGRRCRRRRRRWHGRGRRWHGRRRGNEGLLLARAGRC